MKFLVCQSEEGGMTTHLETFDEVADTLRLSARDDYSEGEARVQKFARFAHDADPGYIHSYPCGVVVTVCDSAEVG
jgi:hypothetical protein